MKNITVLAIVAIFLSGCVASGDRPGVEYAPQMYHSTPYEPLTQIKDKEAGRWLTSTDEESHAEFYNSNRFNKHEMNMRKPVQNTVRRGKYLPARVSKDDLEWAAQNLKNPLDSADASVLKGGKELYERICAHCHGNGGAGDGKVAKVYLGVANLKGAAYANITEGHIFHVITHGKGLMGAHGSQISEEERWMVARYLKKLQQQ